MDSLKELALKGIFLNLAHRVLSYDFHQEIGMMSFPFLYKFSYIFWPNLEKL